MARQAEDLHLARERRVERKYELAAGRACAGAWLCLAVDLLDLPRAVGKSVELDLAAKFACAGKPGAGGDLGSAGSVFGGTGFQ